MNYKETKNPNVNSGLKGLIDFFVPIVPLGLFSYKKVSALSDKEYN